MLTSTIVASLVLAATASAACDRAMLKNATDTYLAAQTAGKPDALLALATPNVVYNENEKPVDIKKGILTTAMAINHTVSLHDTVDCATFTEIIVADKTAPYVLGVRMLFRDANTTKASYIETLVTKPGDWLFNATGYLRWANAESWDPIPAGKRDTRAVIQAAGDAYFNRFASANVSVPFGTPCARLEGGAYTGERNVSGNTCGLGLPSTITVTNRRYVVDEEMGSVVIYVGFPGLDRTQGQKAAPDSHLFRVEGGKIRYIHTISSCVTAGCGAGPIPGSTPPGTKVRRHWRWFW